MSQWRISIIITTFCCVGYDWLVSSGKRKGDESFGAGAVSSPTRTNRRRNKTANQPPTLLPWYKLTFFSLSSRMYRARPLPTLNNTTIYVYMYVYVFSSPTTKTVIYSNTLTYIIQRVFFYAQKTNCYILYLCLIICIWILFFCKDIN